MDKWIIFICEKCGCYFALDKNNRPSEPSCPNCGDDYDITATGEYIKGEAVPYGGVEDNL